MEKVYLRQAVLNDIPDIVALGRVFHAESVDRDIPFDADRLAGFLADLIESQSGLAMLAFYNDQLAGGLLAQLTQSHYSNAIIATDYGLYVGITERDIGIGRQLVAAYTGWAIHSGARKIYLNVSSGITYGAFEAVMNDSNYQKMGAIFQWNV